MFQGSAAYLTLVVCSPATFSALRVNNGHPRPSSLFLKPTIHRQIVVVKRADLFFERHQALPAWFTLCGKSVDDAV
jgi:hypothetical protein